MSRHHVKRLCDLAPARRKAVWPLSRLRLPGQKHSCHLSRESGGMAFLSRTASLVRLGLPAQATWPKKKSCHLRAKVQERLFGQKRFLVWSGAVVACVPLPVAVQPLRLACIALPQRRPAAAATASRLRCCALAPSSRCVLASLRRPASPRYD